MSRKVFYSYTYIPLIFLSVSLSLTLFVHPETTSGVRKQSQVISTMGINIYIEECDSLYEKKEK